MRPTYWTGGTVLGAMLGAFAVVFFGDFGIDPTKGAHSASNWVKSWMPGAVDKCPAADKVAANARAQYRKAHEAAQECANAGLYKGPDWWEQIACAKEHEAEAATKARLDAAKKALCS